MAFRLMCMTRSSGRLRNQRRNSARLFQNRKETEIEFAAWESNGGGVQAMRQNTMHAAALERFGGIDEIRMQTLPTPEIEPDEVLVRVEVAGVAVWDPFEREGGFAKIYGIKPHFPYILGSDGAGTIAEIGNRVRGLKVGDHVYGASLVNPKGGFYAEYIAVKAGDR